MVDTSRGGSTANAKERGATIKAARSALGWTQDKLAAEAGCHVSTVKRVERGIGDEPRELRAILRAVGLSTPAGEPTTGGASGAKVALAYPPMGLLVGPQMPAAVLELARAEMVIMAVRNGDPYEVLHGLEGASVPAGAGPAWWANLYRELLETHWPAAQRRGEKGKKT